MYNVMMFSVSDTDIREEKNFLSSPNRSRTYNLQGRVVQSRVKLTQG